jgi:hypothetical protein
MISASTLLTPSEAASWRVWKPRASAPSEAVDRPADYGDRSKPLVIGLPATACRSVALVLPQADHTLMQQMVASQLEKRGIRGVGGEPAIFRWHQVGHAGPNAILSVDVIAEPFPTDLEVEHAADYTSAFRLCQLPAGQAVIAEEQGELVLAVSQQGKLLHSHIFAQRPADARQLATELTLTRLSLDALPGVQGFTGVTLVGQWDADVASDLRHYAGLPVQVVDRLSPSSSIDLQVTHSLLPRSVSEARAFAAARGKWLRIGALAAVAVAAAVVLGWMQLQSLEKQVEELTASVEQTRAPAAAVKETANRWKGMLPALEPKQYPMVVLSQVTSIMPPSGVLVRDFEFTQKEVEVKGDARDLTTASQFLEDLKKHKDLSRYDWSMPQPQVRDNKTVSYRIQGKSKP